MPGLIVVAATATGVQPTYGLSVGGGNLLGDATSAFGVPIESLEVIEAGPGEVSSMSFSIDDAGKFIGIVEGTEVQFYNFVTSTPLFRGYVDHWSSQPGFGGQGRSIEVSCTGIEAWLDWLKIGPATTLGGGGLNLPPAIAALAKPIAVSLYVPELTGSRNGSRALPIGDLTHAGIGSPPSFAVTIASGTTLREGIAALIAPSYWPGIAAGFPINNQAVSAFVTVDFYGGLRIWENDITLQPDDYTTLTVTDTPASTFVAEDLRFAQEPDDRVREVYISSTTPAGAGWFADGTSIRGRQDVVIDNTSTTAASALLLANAYFAKQSAGIIRSALTLSDFTPPATVHAGSLLALTDAATGATGNYRIYQIRKTFTATKENWTISFGGNPPSAMNYLRRLTRTAA